jgi:hypothetical protein
MFCNIASGPQFIRININGQPGCISPVKVTMNNKIILTFKPIKIALRIQVSL